MIRCFGNGVCDVQQEDPKRKQYHHAYLYFLGRSTEEDGEEKNRRHQTRQNDVHNVESIPPPQVDCECDVCKLLIRTAIERELLTRDLS